MKVQRKCLKKNLITQIKAERAKLALERDALRAIIDEAEELLQNCGDACDALDSAINALSEHV